MNRLTYRLRDIKRRISPVVFFILNLSFSISLMLSASSCSTTKNIPDDDQLFIGLTKIDYQSYEPGDHFNTTREEIEAALATAPNGALFGSSYYRTPFPYGLWIWNWADGSSGVFKKWMKKAFGKAPVLMSQVNPALRASVARSVLRKNGYLHGTVSYEEVPQHNPKKMKIGYTVRLDTLFRVDTIAYVGFPAPMQHLIDSTLDEACIKPGSPFDVASLDAERTRLSRLFRNNGYYYYQTGYASYLADTFDIAGHAQLRLQLADSLPPEALRPWHIGRTRVELRRSMREQLSDSIDRRFLKVFYNGKHSPIRPRVILRDLKLRPRRLFSNADYQESIQKINANGIFSSVDLQLTPRLSQLSALSSHASQDTLDMTLSCTFDKPYDFYVETNFVNRTIGRLGPELKLGFTKRNAFRGAEKLDINLHGAYEWQVNGGGSDMNSYEYGADASIEFPRIIAPFVNRTRRTGPNGRRRPRQFYATPWTIAKVSSDIVRRPSYYKMHIVSGEWTYRWQPSATSRHELSPLILKYQYMNSHTEQFDQLLAQNPYLQATMDDYFIPKMRYTYTYASPSNLRNPIRWETSIEQAGNLTALYDVLIQGHEWNQRGKTLFKNPYSQFIRIETDLVKTWTLDPKTQLVGHLNWGLLWSYGNADEAPFSELFYVGGANSIRAFTVRSIGPGSFQGIPGNSQFSYLMQNGDSKFVANLELRRRLFGSLYGAVFLDAGNVWNSRDWTLQHDDEDDQTTHDFIDTWNDLFAHTGFHANKFFRELATGTGIGLRYDLDFLVLRVDWGFGLHLPYDTGKSGYLNIPRFSDMHSLHIAIGYPF